MVKLFIGATLALTLSSAPAFAQSISVDRPEMLRGRFLVEFDTFGINNSPGQDDTYAQEALVAFTFTDAFRMGVGLIVEDGDAAPPRVGAYLAEMRFAGRSIASLPLSWGLAGTYVGGGPEGVNDLLRLRASAAREIGPVTLLANLDALREVGGGAATDTGVNLLLETQMPVGHAIKAALTYSGQLGADRSFLHLGAQGHYVGPTLYAFTPIGANSAIGLETGVLLGLTDESADAVGKVSLTWASQF